MKAILILLDSLNRHYLSAYGCDWVHAMNIARFAQRAADAPSEQYQRLGLEAS
ncbi:MAG: hypothetical protein PF961_06080 [Planctomycetota bacterium]|jgi:hypothetical protein|nr:hypothetical protein [Planctomycetota bacterium]